jgi:hypothetical protein
MRHYQRIIAYGTMIAAALGLLGCDIKPQEPKYINGTVKSERSQTNILNPHRYFFTLSTEDGLKRFVCAGDRGAPQMDALLDPKDQVKFKITGYQGRKENDFSVDLDDIVEINGEPFSR